MDLTGKEFGMLKVLRRDPYNTNVGTYWICQCSCQKKNRIPLLCSIRQDKLLNEETKSCGCLKLKQKTRGEKDTNIFDISNEYGIGIIKDGRKFYFDLEDYSLITSVSKSWHINDGGYISARDMRDCAERYKDGRKKYVYLKDIVMHKEKGEIVKFINDDKTDCRKSNLVKYKKHIETN